MKLSEKILYCRKKAALSQEALAELLGVSRQAVSKWETGEASPDINKLLALSKAFGVTTDWLLSEDEPAFGTPSREESASDESYHDTPPYEGVRYEEAASNWVESIPGVLGKLIRRYGWLFGVYTAISGLGFTVIGALARGLTKSMLSSSFTGQGSTFAPSSSISDALGHGPGAVIYTQYGDVWEQAGFSAANLAASNNPVYLMGTFIMVIGIIVMIAGIVLAVWLKSRSGTPGKG